VARARAAHVPVPAAAAVVRCLHGPVRGASGAPAAVRRLPVLRRRPPPRAVRPGGGPAAVGDGRELRRGAGPGRRPAPAPPLRRRGHGVPGHRPPPARGRARRRPQPRRALCPGPGQRRRAANRAARPHALRRARQPARRRRLRDRPPRRARLGVQLFGLRHQPPPPRGPVRRVPKVAGDRLRPGARVRRQLGGVQGQARRDPVGAGGERADLGGVRRGVRPGLPRQDARRRAAAAGDEGGVHGEGEGAPRRASVRCQVHGGELRPRGPARRWHQKRRRKPRRAAAHRGTAMPRRAQEPHGMPDPYGDEVAHPVPRRRRRLRRSHRRITVITLAKKFKE
jgi:hypothetical protein